MSGARSEPPWDFFHDASIASLQSFELSRLNHAANIRREIAALLDQWVSENSQALLARWVRQHRALPRTARQEPPAIMAEPLPNSGSLLSCDSSLPLPFEAPFMPVLLPRRTERPQRQRQKQARLHRR